MPSGPTSEKLKKILAEIVPSRIKDTVLKLVSFRTRQTFSKPESGREGVEAARTWLQSQLLKWSLEYSPRITVDVHPFEAKNRFTGATAEGKDIILTLRGLKEPKQVIVVGAHYDSLNMHDKTDNAEAPGANDDGSGSALVLELARAFSAHTFDRTIMLVLFDGEEHGLQGSKALAKKLKESDMTVVAMMNNDIVGGDLSATEKNANDCRLFSAGATDAPTRRLALQAKLTGQLAVPEFHLLVQDTLDRPGRSGDHIPFHQAGFPAIRFIETHENAAHHHTPDDRPEFVQSEYAANVAKLNASLLLSLADGLPAPQGVALHGQKLSWRPVAEARGYWVVGIKGGWNSPEPFWMEYVTGTEIDHVPAEHQFVVSAVRLDGTTGWPSEEAKRSNR